MCIKQTRGVGRPSTKMNFIDSIIAAMTESTRELHQKGAIDTESLRCLFQIMSDRHRQTFFDNSQGLFRALLLYVRFPPVKNMLGIVRGMVTLPLVCHRTTNFDSGVVDMASALPPGDATTIVVVEMPQYDAQEIAVLRVREHRSSIVVTINAAFARFMPHNRIHYVLETLHCNSLFLLGNILDAEALAPVYRGMASVILTENHVFQTLAAVMNPMCTGLVEGTLT